LEGKHGFANLVEHSALSELLVATATAKPSTALRTFRLAGKAGKTQLRQVQTLKRQSVQARFGIKNLGQLREFVSKNSAMPAIHTRGFLSYISVGKPGENLKVTVVATTRVLQERWANDKNCLAAADGGFKFNLMGWSLHVVGQVNPAGNFSLYGLALTSSMAKEHVTDMLTGFANSVIRRSGCGPDGVKKALAMSDAELAFRQGLAQAFSSANLMCYFHIKQAARDNLDKRFPATRKEKDEAWAAISSDIDLMRGAMSHPDFLSRAAASGPRKALRTKPHGLTSRAGSTTLLGASSPSGLRTCPSGTWVWLDRSWHPQQTTGPRSAFGTPAMMQETWWDQSAQP
jgi:hypothetical protein